jgi:hypothetical protein
MLGAFRFVLAWFVMLSHMPYSPFPINFNLRVTSVTIFYFISSYLMYISFSQVDKYSLKKSILTFYKKRASATPSNPSKLISINRATLLHISLYIILYAKKKK